MKLIQIKTNINSRKFKQEKNFTRTQNYFNNLELSTENHKVYYIFSTYIGILQFNVDIIFS